LPFSFLGHEGQDVYLGFPRASAIAARVPGLFSILTVNSFILAMADLLERKTSGQDWDLSCHYSTSRQVLALELLQRFLHNHSEIKQKQLHVVEVKPMARDATAPELGGRYVRVGQLADLQSAECVVVHVKEHTLALFSRGEHIYAVDNRCPHLGFPLNRGTVKEGILTCHWHHARFDLASGGTFDQWADDVPVFPVQIRHGEVWVDLSPRGDAGAHQRQR